MLLVLSLLLLLVTVPTFHHRLESSRAAFAVNNCVFGADNALIGAALDRGAFSGLKIRKHPIAVGLVAGASWPFLLVGLTERTATSLAIALLQGLGAVAMFLFLARHWTTPATALAMTLFHLSLFGPATLFGVTDSYGITFAVSAIGVLTLGELARMSSFRAARFGAGLGVAAAGLANPPAMAILPVWPAMLKRREAPLLPRRIAGEMLIVGAIATVIAVLVPLVLSAGWGVEYARRYASLEAIRNPDLFRDYVAGFFLFSLVSPLDAVRCRYPAGLVGDFSALGLVALAGSAMVLLGGLVAALKSDRARPLALAALAGSAGLFLFYLWFNAGEVMLYSSQWLFLLCLGAAAGVSGRAWIAIVPVVVLNLTVNLPPLHHAHSSDPMRCCPDPPGSMLPHEHPLAQARRLCSPGRMP